MSEKEEVVSPGPYGPLHLGRGTFGTAVSALKAGEMVCRKGWNGKEMFVFMQVPADISMETVPKMQSLPEKVKELFAKRFHNHDSDETNPEFDHIHYRNQLALVKADNHINGWVPSVSDSLATDWEIYEGK